MRNIRGTLHSLPNQQTLTIIAQDPSIAPNDILTAQVRIPAEELIDGPCGYRVHVIDYDATSNILYEPAKLRPDPEGGYVDPFAVDDNGPGQTRKPKGYDTKLLTDPTFHAQNVYAIVMRTLARFEFALGRRVAWGSNGHQIHVAPHAFADANAFYSRDDRAIFFGYFPGNDGKTVFTCLSHDVVAHETTHALLDGLRARYMEQSSPDQAAFHEGFADVVALLSVFSLPEIIGELLDRTPKASANTIDEKFLKPEALRQSALFGLAEEMGSAISAVRGEALRRSVTLERGKRYMSMAEFDEPHERGELLVAAMMNAFLDIWNARLERIGFVAKGKKDRNAVTEEGAMAADHLLTMAIRALDYCPPTDLRFSDYLSALLTVDGEVVPDDRKYGYRQALLDNFAAYDIRPAPGTDKDGRFNRCDQELVYSRSHFDSMLRDPEEVFRFIWENKRKLKIDTDSYVEVQSVRPCARIGPDGFILRETVAEYVQILTLEAGELKRVLKIERPEGVPSSRRIRIFGGGSLIFDEYGQLKYQIANRIEDSARQADRLEYLARIGTFDEPPDPAVPSSSASYFALLHRMRAMG